jgi:transglutaminase-like putative cysteine protease
LSPRPSLSRITRALLVPVVAGLIAVAATLPSAEARAETAAASTERELRYEQLAFAMGGHEVGLTTARDVEVPGGYRLERSSRLELDRGGSQIRIQTRAVSEVGRDLSPRRFRFEKTDAAGTFVLEGDVKDGVLVLTTTGGGSEVRTEVQLKPNTTFAAAGELWIRQNLRDGARFERDVIIEEMGAVKPMRASVKKTASGFLVEATMATLVITEELDPAGNLKVSRTPALGALAYPVGVPPPEGIAEGKVDMYARSVWPAPTLPDKVARVRYRIVTPDAKTFAIPEDDRQRVVARRDGALEVEVRGLRSTHGPLTPADRRALTAATPYEAIEDARLLKAAREQTRGASTTRQKVHRLVRFVHDHVQAKNLDRGYAPATATLESQTGDCTEHSVLLSALLRTLGVPTRLVDGVVVDGGRAGYHEWVEVQIDDEGFVPADPTFGEFPASVARLKLAEGSSSPEGLLDLGIAAGRILRPGVKIEVVEFTAAAR